MKTTGENNRLIAEFMGAKYDKDTSFPMHPDDLWLPMHGICNFTGTNGKCLKYNSSWDWLMPVVSKITSIFTKWEYESEQRKKAEDIFDMTNLFDEFITGDISSVLNRCVEFIEWYNDQNKS